LTHSDKVVALSQTFLDRITQVAEKSKCVLIYAAADLDRFRQPPHSQELSLQSRLHGKTVFVYSGGLGAWHDPLLLARIYKVISQAFNDSQLLVISGYNHDKLKSVFRAGGLTSADYAIVSAEADEVPAYLMAGNFGIVPLKEVGDRGPFGVIADTMIGTKVAEYLAASLPLIVNKGVRGILPLMERFKLGIQFDPSDLEAIIPGISDMKGHYHEYQADCQFVANRYFSQDHAVSSYHELYETLRPDPHVVRGDHTPDGNGTRPERP
jgi:glycosyltransferase involved in cell wall biosynthesis